MASHFELESFVRKFVNLWKSGCDAKLNIESEGGRAFVNLRVGLGDGHPGHHDRVERHRGGGPAKQRRRERRESERRVAAEKAVENPQNLKDAVEETIVKIEVAEEVTKKEILDVPFAQSNADDNKAHFEVKLEAHEKCSNKDAIEAIQENFYGELEN